MKIHKLLAIFAATLLAAGCASMGKSPDQSAKPAQTSARPESRIEGNFPANSPFAKIKLGMTQGQVHEILGQPTDTKSYQTGKAWIPFYFGPDVMRTDEFYKGVGVITYTGAGIGGVHWTVFRAIYNPAEDGYPNI
jgi:type IV pilus biogenesis protein CpaD/CtpE